MIRWNKRIVLAFLYAFYTLLAFMFLFPFGWSLLNSVKTAVEASAAPPTFFPTAFSAENYIALTEYGVGIFSYTKNSVMTAAITVALSVVLSTSAGYGFARLGFPLKRVLFFLILSSMVLPFQTIITPLFLVMHSMGLSNTLVGLALVHTVIQIAFGTLVMRNTFAAIPLEIEEAARLDGCGTLRIIAQVLLPLALPGLVTVGIIAFVNSWNEFLAALIFISDEKLYTLPVMLSNIRSGPYGAIDWGKLQAGIIIAAAPSLAVFFLAQKQYINGLTGGSVKG